MNPEALLLLLETPVMMRLAHGWPLVTGDRTLNAKSHVPNETAEEWADVSGVGVNDVRVWERAMFAHGIITPDGKINDVALAVIRRHAMKKLPPEIRKEAKSGHREDAGGAG